MIRNRTITQAQQELSVLIESPSSPRPCTVLWRAVGIEAAVLALLAAVATGFFYDVLIAGNHHIPYDLNDWHYPQLAFLARWLGHGHFPLWNPHFYAGMPSIGDIQAAACYPVNLLFLAVGGWMWGEIPYRWVEYESILHYLIAGWGAYWLGRDFRLDRLPAILLGIAYMTGPTMASQAQHFGLIIGMAWLPVIAIFARRTLSRPGSASPILLAVACAMLIFGGFPPSIVSCGLALAGFFCWGIARACWQRRQGAGSPSRIVLRGLLASAMVLALTAVQLLPFVETVNLSEASVARHYIAFGPPLRQLITAIVPNYYNEAKPGEYWGGGDYTLAHYYISPMLLLLATVALGGSRARAARWLGGAAVLSLLAATDVCASAAGVLNLLPASVRGALELYEVRKFYDLAVAIMAAMALDDMLRSRMTPIRKTDLRLAAVAMATVVLLAISGIVAYHAATAASAPLGVETSNARHAGVMLGSSLASMGWIAVSGLVSMVLLRKQNHHAATLATIAVLLTLLPHALYGSHRPFNSYRGAPDSGITPTRVSSNSELVAFLKGRSGVEGPFRYDYPGTMAYSFGTCGALWGIDNANGCNPLFSRDMNDFRDPLSLKSSHGRPFRFGTVVSPIFNLLNIRYFITSDADRENADLHTMYPAGFTGQFRMVFWQGLRVYENTGALPRAFVVENERVVSPRANMIRLIADQKVNLRDCVLLEDAGSTPLPQMAAGSARECSVQYIMRNPDRIQVLVNGSPGGWLVVLDPFWPGWNATIDGAPARIHRADYMFRAIAMPPGNHKVVMRYSPRSFTLGLAITIAGVAVAAGVLASSSRHRPS